MQPQSMAHDPSFFIPVPIWIRNEHHSKTRIEDKKPSITRHAHLTKTSQRKGDFSSYAERKNALGLTTFKHLVIV